MLFSTERESNMAAKNAWDLSDGSDLNEEEGACVEAVSKGGKHARMPSAGTGKTRFAVECAAKGRSEGKVRRSCKRGESGVTYRTL